MIYKKALTSMSLLSVMSLVLMPVDGWGQPTEKFPVDIPKTGNIQNPTFPQDSLLDGPIVNFWQPTQQGDFRLQEASPNIRMMIHRMTLPFLEQVESYVLAYQIAERVFTVPPSAFSQLDVQRLPLATVQLLWDEGSNLLLAFTVAQRVVLWQRIEGLPVAPLGELNVQTLPLGAVLRLLSGNNPLLLAFSLEQQATLWERFEESVADGESNHQDRSSETSPVLHSRKKLQLQEEEQKEDGGEGSDREEGDTWNPNNLGVSQMSAVQSVLAATRTAINRVVGNRGPQQDEERSTLRQSQTPHHENIQLEPIIQQEPSLPRRFWNGVQFVEREVRDAMKVGVQKLCRFCNPFYQGGGKGSKSL